MTATTQMLPMFQSLPQKIDLKHYFFLFPLSYFQLQAIVGKQEKKGTYGHMNVALY